MQGRILPFVAIVISLISAGASTWSALTADRAHDIAERTLALSEEDVRVLVSMSPHNRIYLHDVPEINALSLEVDLDVLITNVETRPSSILHVYQLIMQRTSSRAAPKDSNMITEDGRVLSLPMFLQPGLTHKMKAVIFVQLPNLPASTIPAYFKECTMTTFGGLAGYVLNKTGRNIYGDDVQGTNKVVLKSNPCDQFLANGACGHPDTISIAVRLESASSKKFVGVAPLTPYDCG